MYYNTHTLKIPSIDKSIQYREYTVGEEKEILLIDSSNEDEIIKYQKILNLVKKCILTEGIDYTKISQAEIIYIFIHIRMCSVDDKSIVSVPCSVCLDKIIKTQRIITSMEEHLQTVDDKVSLSKEITEKREELQQQYRSILSDVEINLSDIKLITEEGHTQRIKLSEQLTLDMYYGLNDIDNHPLLCKLPSNTIEEIEERTILLTASNIHTVYDGENTITPKNLEEKVNIFKSMSRKYRKPIEDFLTKQPRVEYKGTTKCANCKNKSFEFTLEGVNDFF